MSNQNQSKNQSTDTENPIAEYIESNRDRVCRVFDKVLCELESERIKDAPLNQLVSALGTLIDKFGKTDDAADGTSGTLGEILNSYKDII